MNRIDRAYALLDALDSPGEVAKSFARIILELFPSWFDFGTDKLAILTWDLGFHLVVSGPAPVRDPTIAVISTSDSRNISCTVTRTAAGASERAQMNLHYTPSDDQRERARAVIALALRRLYPDREVDLALAALVPAGKVFPPGW